MVLCVVEQTQISQTNDIYSHVSDVVELVTCNK